MTSIQNVDSLTKAIQPLISMVYGFRCQFGTVDCVRVIVLNYILYTILGVSLPGNTISHSR